MATIRKRDGKFQAQVRRDGIFKSATFFKKSDAEIWARQVGYEFEELKHRLISADLGIRSAGPLRTRNR